jgi:Big-like domain-containing protein
VQQATLTTANVQLFSGNSKMPAKATLSKTSTSVTLTPSSKLDANTTYRAVVGTGLKDLAGNALDQDQNPNNGNQPKQWTFTTGPK